MQLGPSEHSSTATIPTLTPDAEEQLSKDKSFLATMEQRVQKTQTFEKLNRSQQDEVLKGKRWRRDQLTNKAETLFGRKFGGPMYRYLSAYVHSDFLSVLQVRDNAERSKQKAMAEGGLAMACVCISKLIEGYLALWPILQMVANRYPDAQGLVEAYSSFRTFGSAQYASPG